MSEDSTPENDSTSIESSNEDEKFMEELDAGDTPDAREIPPATFATLLNTLAMQAMGQLGVLPDPMTGKPTVNKPIAKHIIDTVAMLEEKTKGNLDEEESQMLKELLHQMRMIFVSAKATPPEPGSNIVVPESKIVLP